MGGRNNKKKNGDSLSTINKYSLITAKVTTGEVARRRSERVGSEQQADTICYYLCILPGVCLHVFFVEFSRFPHDKFKIHH